MGDLKNKTLIVTGASLGIGRALALELARRGVNLVLNARHSPLLKEVAQGCGEFGVKVRRVAGSAGRESNVRKLIEAASGIGNFYGFIHAAGVLYPGPFLWELSADAFREVFEASVIAAHQLVRFSIPELLETREGFAIFFGSGAAERQTPGIGAYSAAKAAEEHLACQLAVEAPWVTAFVYRPGVVETRMQQEARQASGGGGEEVRRRFCGYKDRGELLSPEDAARALVRIMERFPRRFHGRIVNWNDELSKGD